MLDRESNLVLKELVAQVHDVKLVAKRINSIGELVKTVCMDCNMSELMFLQNAAIYNATDGSFYLPNQKLGIDDFLIYKPQKKELLSMIYDLGNESAYSQTFSVFSINTNFIVIGLPGLEMMKSTFRLYSYKQVAPEVIEALDILHL